MKSDRNKRLRKKITRDLYRQVRAERLEEKRIQELVDQRVSEILYQTTDVISQKVADSARIVVTKEVKEQIAAQEKPTLVSIILGLMKGNEK